MLTEPLRIIVSLCLIVAVLVGRLAPECGCSHPHSNQAHPSEHAHPEHDGSHSHTTSEPCEHQFDPPETPDCLCKKAVSPDSSTPRLILPDTPLAGTAAVHFDVVTTLVTGNSKSSLTFHPVGAGLRTLYCSLTC